VRTAISIKPHHFVDILAALGAGKTSYDYHPYGHALHTVAVTILGNPDIRLRVELGPDDICAPCVHNVDGKCDDVIDTSYRPTAPKSKADWNLRIDIRWCQRLEINQGDTLSARELCQRILIALEDAPLIYEEMPAEMTAERISKLSCGIETYLGRQSGEIDE
jgi:hypothetical protein